MTHKERILRHLQSGESITSWEAIKEYGCTRLSQYILLLKKDGYDIQSKTVTGENRYGDPTHYTEYRLEDENER